jgi:outer membrane protein TolC
MTRSVPAVLLIALIGLGASRGAFAQSGKDKAAIQANRIEDLVRQAAAQFAAAEQRPPAQPMVSAQAGEPYALRLDDAVKFALEHNLDIAVERLNPQTYDLQIAGLLAAYRPTVSSTFGQNNRVLLPTSTLNGGTRVKNETLTYNGGASQLLPWGGASFATSFNNSRTATDSANSNFNPNFTSVFAASYVQPLLRGFKVDSTRQQLRVTAISRDISENQLQAQVTNTLSSVRNAYWDFVFAVQAVDVARQSLELAEKLVDDNKTRVEIGTMAPIDVVQAEAEAATRRQVLTQAEATMRTAELALKRLIVGGTDDPLWRGTLSPVDQPEFTPEAVDLDSAVRTALDKRSDLVQARRQLESNDVVLGYLQNQTMPSIDVQTTYALQGIGGTQFQRQDPRRADSPIVNTFPGNYFDALRALGAASYPNWSMQLNVSYPIGQSNAQAQLARARVQRSQAQAQLRALELQVATEVTNAALNVQNAQQRVQSASAARELQERRLEAEQSKFDVGLSTNFLVVQAQRDLRDAQNTELRALLDHRKSLVEFDRVQQTSLSRAGITVVNAGAAGANAAAAATANTGGGNFGGGNFGGGAGR